MLSNELISHLLVAVIYFLAVSLLRFKLDINLLWLWLGAFVGTFILDIDHLLYWFYLHPEKEDSIEAKRILNLTGIKLEDKIKQLYKHLIASHNTHHRLIFHTATFQVILLVVAFFLVSSSGNFFGSAMILAINLHLLKDEWQVFFKDKQGLVDWLFWQVREIPVAKYLDGYMVVVSLIFLLLTGLII